MEATIFITGIVVGMVISGIVIGYLWLDTVEKIEEDKKVWKDSRSGNSTCEHNFKTIVKPDKR